MQPRAAGREPDADSQTPEEDVLRLGSFQQSALVDGLIVHVCIFHVHTCNTGTRYSATLSNLFFWENTCKSDQEHIHSTQQEHFMKP